MKSSKSEREPAVIYARYSSAVQREESIEQQIRDCTDYARRNNLRIIHEYTDKALTGRTDKRPGFQQMLRDSSKHQFKYVICWKLDRFSRDRYDSAVYKAKLKKNGVKLLYAMEQIPEGPEGIILESVLAGFAEYYSANLSQNVLRGLTDSAMSRKAIGKPPFGYRKGSDGLYELDPLTAPAVEKIFADYSKGVPAVEIIEYLNAAGYKTSRGYAFGKSSIKRIIRNEKYMGIYEWGDIRIENGMPAIVNKETWDKCQKMADRHHSSPAAQRDVHYMLTGKIKCALCGSNMIGESCTSKSGKIHYYYTCFSRRKGEGCAAPRLRKDETEEYVCNALLKLVKAPDFADNIAGAVMDYIERECSDTSERDALVATLKETTTRHDNILRAIEMGVITAGTKARLQELEEEMEKLRTSIAQKDMERPTITKEHIIYFFQQVLGSDQQDHSEDLIDCLLNCVYIYEDHADFVLNYTKSAEPVTFTDYRSALDLFGECSPSGHSLDWMPQKANYYVFGSVFMVRLPK